MPIDHSNSVVLVGHCGPDMFMLRSAVSRVFPEAAIVSVNDSAGLDEHRNKKAIWLVNRVLDGEFGAPGGIELIAAEASNTDAPALLLISDIDEAQQEAVSRGALPGFGKRALYEQQTAQRLRDAISRLGSNAE